MVAKFTFLFTFLGVAFVSGMKHGATQCSGVERNLADMLVDAEKRESLTYITEKIARIFSSNENKNAMHSIMKNFNILSQPENKSLAEETMISLTDMFVSDENMELMAYLNRVQELMLKDQHYIQTVRVVHAAIQKILADDTASRLIHTMLAAALKIMEEKDILNAILVDSIRIINDPEKMAFLTDVGSKLFPLMGNINQIFGVQSSANVVYQSSEDFNFPVIEEPEDDAPLPEDLSSIPRRKSNTS